MDEPTHPLGDSLEALRTSGLLFALNQHVLHGLGYEVRVEQGELLLLGFGGGPRRWEATVTDEDLDGAWRRFRQTLLDGQRVNHPGYNTGRTSAGLAARGATSVVTGGR